MPYKKLNKNYFLEIIPIGMILIVIVFTFPLFVQIVSGSIYKNICISFQSWVLPLVRTLIFSLLTVILQIILGFYLAIRLHQIKGRIRHLFGMFLIPALIGSVVVGFVFKLGIINNDLVSNSIANRAFIPTWGLMLTLQIWQFVTLFAYLFWIRLSNINDNIMSFSYASHLNVSELIRDIYWPQCRDIASLLALFSVVECYSEYIKFHLILRASEGTGTELISHWLLRYYNFYSPIDPRNAINNTLSMGILFTLIGLLFALIFVYFLNRYSIKFFNMFAKPFSIGLTNKYSCNLMSIFLIIISIFPFTSLAPYVFKSSFVEISGFLRSCFLTLVVVSIVMICTIIFGFITRIIWPKLLDSLNKSSLSLLGGLYLLHLVPPLCIALSGYYWIAFFNLDFRNEIYSILIWIFGQVILVFPILSIFILLNHFRLKNTELNFQFSSRTNLIEKFRFSFLNRFGLDYILIFLFGFSFVWSESTLNSIMSNLSRNLPSIAVELTQRIDGRGGSYFEAANLILVIFIPVIIGIIIWSNLLKRNRLIKWSN